MNEIDYIIDRSKDLLYLCNPLANQKCPKLTCFWDWTKYDDGGEPRCYKTTHEEFAARDAEGNPIVWPEGEKTVEKLKSSMATDPWKGLKQKRKAVKSTMHARKT